MNKKPARKNKNDNPIYYACHAILDASLWFSGEDECDRLFRLHHVRKRLKHARKKLYDGDYSVEPIRKLINAVEFWEANEAANLDEVDRTLEVALKFYMFP